MPDSITEEISQEDTELQIEEEMSTIHPTDEQWRMYLALIEQQKLDAVRAQKEATDTLVKQIEAERKQNQEVQAGLLEKKAELVDATSTEDNGGGEMLSVEKKFNRVLEKLNSYKHVKNTIQKSKMLTNGCSQLWMKYKTSHKPNILI